MTDERLKELNALHDKIEQAKSDIRAIEGGPYGVAPSNLELRAVYTNDPSTDYILTISEDNYPELKDLMLTYLNDELAKLEKEFKEG